METAKEMIAALWRLIMFVSGLLMVGTPALGVISGDVTIYMPVIQFLPTVCIFGIGLLLINQSVKPVPKKD